MPILSIISFRSTKPIFISLSFLKASFQPEIESNLGGVRERKAEGRRRDLDLSRERERTECIPSGKLT